MMQKCRNEHPWITLLIALCTGWLGVNAVWGLTGPDDTLLSGWMGKVAPLGVWLAGVYGVLAILWVLSLRSRSDRGKAVRFSVLIVGLYLGGVAGFEALYNAIRPALGSTGVPATSIVDGLRFALHRSFMLLPVIPMVLAWRLGPGARERRVPLRFGNWRAQTRVKLPLLGYVSWSWAFLLVAVFVGLPFFLVFQSQVGFEPILCGALFRMAPALLLMALANGLVEEVVFRGFFLSALTPATGVRAAVWLQAIFFGLHHFGSSPVPMQALTTMLVSTLVGYLLGRSVVGTRGLGWAVLIHMMADLTFFSVTHVVW